MLTIGFSLKDIPCPGHSQKTLPKKKKNQKTEDVLASFHCCERGILKSDAHFTCLWKNLPEGHHQVYDQHQSLNQQQLRVLAINLFPSCKKKGFLQAAGPEVPIHSLPQNQRFSEAVKAVDLLVHYKTG